MKERKEYDRDDGHTVADMSGISRPPAFIPRRAKPQRQEEENSFLFEKKDETPLTPEERRMYVFAALKASLLIAAAFIAGLGAVILVMVLAWG